MSQGLFASLYSKEKPFTLIDTRERRDYVDGHWFGSTNVPLSLLGSQMKKLVPQLDFPIHFLDWQDAISAAAYKQLSQLGYANIVHHSTSHPDSFGCGFVKGEFVWSKAFGEVLAHTCGLQEITPAEYLAHYKDAQLFDVRPTAEYSQFTIPGSQSLPNSLLLANMEPLKQSGNRALLHCAGRTRSIIGACTLKAAGYDGHYVIFKGGTQAWQLDGLEREFQASRVFAKESNNAKPINNFLHKWKIKYTHVEHAELESFVEQHRTQLMFDVSNDAAIGEIAIHGIMKISGTNLIQQTDRSIARFHVPVILFDNGSGSRAAFAAYWLQSMGFTVSVVYLSDEIENINSPNDQSAAMESPYSQFSIDQLLAHKNLHGEVLDFRSSKDFAKAHLSGALWKNISEMLSMRPHPAKPVALIGNDMAHVIEAAYLLEQYNIEIAGLHCWNVNNVNPKQLETETLESAIDQSALFAQRHHGNMQDSRDYLAWEEALPGQIDDIIEQTWLAQLNEVVG